MLHKTVKPASTSSIILGALTIVLGMVAIGSPLVSGLAVTLLVAVALLVAGVAKTIFAFRAGSFGQDLMRLLFGGLTIIAGLIMLFQPGMALATLTLVLGIYFLLDGVSTLVAAFRYRTTHGWGWMAFNGIITLVLAAIIIGEWPVSGVWAIGLLVGVRLVFSGLTILILGSAGRRLAKAMEH
jgi:uncharacterized membrane protein HdeD (DUF308 family)